MQEKVLRDMGMMLLNDWSGPIKAVGEASYFRELPVCPAIDIAALPSVPMHGLDYLPCRPGVYFLLSESGEVLYIGRSGSISGRWVSHSRGKGRFASREYAKTRIAWFETENYVKTERALIRKHKPPLNTVGTWRDESE